MPVFKFSLGAGNLQLEYLREVISLIRLYHSQLFYAAKAEFRRG